MFRQFTYDPKDPQQRTSFEIHDVDLSIVNGIRRTILTDIPVVGFQGEEDPSIRVLENTGRLHNEFLMHRIGMLPLHFTEEETEAFPADEFKFVLDITNPNDEMLNVTTKDFTGTKNDEPLSERDLRRLFPSHPVTQEHILITRLKPRERIHLEATPVKKTARIHAGFCPVSICTLKFMTDPKLEKQATTILDKERAYARNEYGDPKDILFTLETEIGLSSRYLVAKALDVMEAKLQKVMTEIVLDASDYVQIQPTGVTDKTTAYLFEFDQEDDTLGNLLQSWIHVNHIRNPGSTPTLPSDVSFKYVGYVCPHPLQYRMHLRMDMAHNQPTAIAKEVFVEFLAVQCQQLIDSLNNVRQSWLAFAPKTNIN